MLGLSIGLKCFFLSFTFSIYILSLFLSLLFDFTRHAFILLDLKLILFFRQSIVEAYHTHNIYFLDRQCMRCVFICTKRKYLSLYIQNVCSCSIMRETYMSESSSQKAVKKAFIFHKRENLLASNHFCLYSVCGYSVCGCACTVDERNKINQHIYFFKLNAIKSIPYIVLFNG